MDRQIGTNCTSLLRKAILGALCFICEASGGFARLNRGAGECRNAANWTNLSRDDFVDNQVECHLFALAYNLGGFL